MVGVCVCVCGGGGGGVLCFDNLGRVCLCFEPEQACVMAKLLPESADSETPEK